MSEDEIVKKVKRQPSQWNYISHTAYKGRVSRICEELFQLKNKKTNNAMKTMGQSIWKDSFPKKTYKKPMITWKNAQHRVIREMHIKTAMRPLHAP